MNGRGLVLVVSGAGLGALVLAAIASRGSGRMSSDSTSWFARVLARVLGHESGSAGYGAMNLDRDGAGLSFGLLQWSQVGGGLGELLTEMRSADPALFAATFGPGWETLLSVTLMRSRAPVYGAVLWREPWIGRFRQAAADPVFRRVQDDLVRTGTHWQGAMSAARVLGLATERSLAMLFDTSVQQGPSAAQRIAGQVVAAFRQAGVAEVEARRLLAAYAEAAAAPFRRQTAPASPHPSSPRIQWQPVGEEWHAYAGSIDLYTDILRRRTSILDDAALSDADVELT